jgi:hypothetical protein
MSCRSIEGHGVNEEGETLGEGGRSTVRAALRPGRYEFYSSYVGTGSSSGSRTGGSGVSGPGSSSGGSSGSAGGASGTSAMGPERVRGS